MPQPSQAAMTLLSNRIDAAFVRRLAQAGRSDREIAENLRLGFQVTKDQIAWFRRSRNIPPGKRFKGSKITDPSAKRFENESMARYRCGNPEKQERLFKAAIGDRLYDNYTVSRDPGPVARPENGLGYGNSPLA